MPVYTVDDVCEMMREICTIRGGLCLSGCENYQTLKSNVVMQCNYCNHEWTTTFRTITRVKSWCQNCGSKKSGRDTLYDILRKIPGFTAKNFVKDKDGNDTEKYEDFCRAWNSEAKVAVVYIDRYAIMDANYVRFKPDNTINRKSEYVQKCININYQAYLTNYEKFKNSCYVKGFDIVTIDDNDFSQGGNFIIMKIFKALGNEQAGVTFCVNNPKIAQFMEPIEDHLDNRNPELWLTDADKLITGLDPQVYLPRSRFQLNKICNKRGGKCLDFEKFKNHMSDLTMQCNYGHIWTVSLCNLVANESWCPSCCHKRMSENIVRQMFVELFPNHKFTLPIRPEWLRYENGALIELDGYNDELKIAFEYNGKQHYKLDKMMHRPDDVTGMTDEQIDLATRQKFAAQQARDAFKVKKCKELGIKLIVISYKDLKKDVKIVKKQILEQVENIASPPKNWVNTNATIVRSNATDHLIQKMRDCIIEDAPDYTLVDESIIWEKKVPKFLVKCPNPEHPAYRTAYDNFHGHNRNGRRCGECGGKTKLNNEKLLEQLQEKWPHIRLIDDYVNDRTPIRFACYRCMGSFTATPSAIKTRKRRNNDDAHEGCVDESADIQ